MEDKLLKVCKYVLWALLGISVVLLGYCMFKGAVSTDIQMYLAYALAVLLVLAILFSPIYGAIVNPGNIKKIVIAIGLFAIVALVSYLISPGATLSEEYRESMGITEGIEKVCDFLMFFVYIMLGGTIAAVIYSAVAKLFN